MLAWLWSGKWMGECPDCGGRAYIFKAGGSPLSGSYYCHAVCPACREIVNSKQAEGFAVLMKIVGRVWSELDDYKNGRYWLCKNPDLLQTLECFREHYKAADNFFDPRTKNPSNTEFIQAVDKLLDNTIISFAYLKNSDGEPITEHIVDVETQLHDNLVTKYKLERGWVGDGGKNLSKGSDNQNHELCIKYTVNPIRVEICNNIV